MIAIRFLDRADDGPVSENLNKSLVKHFAIFHDFNPKWTIRLIFVIYPPE